MLISPPQNDGLLLTFRPLLSPGDASPVYEEASPVLKARTTGYLLGFPAFYGRGEDLVTTKGRTCTLY
jgi:hypothetical protein